MKKPITNSATTNAMIVATRVSNGLKISGVQLVAAARHGRAIDLYIW